METELRNHLLVTTFALQAVVAQLAKQAKSTNPNFEADVEALLMPHLLKSDQPTREATLDAMRNLLRA